MDFVLGAHFADGGCLTPSATFCGSGVVYLWNVSTSNFSFFGEFFGRDSSDSAGRSVGVGDFDGDGFADFVLGAITSEGGCLNDSSDILCGSGFVYLWNVSTSNFTFWGEFFGVSDGDNAGRSVGVGDFDGDGFADFVLGAFRAEGGCLNDSSNSNCGSGVVYLWNTSTSNFSFWGEFFGVSDGDGAGDSVGVGDFNNDSFMDFVLGGINAEGGCLNDTSNSGCGSGVVYLWNVSTGNFSFFGEFFGVSDGDEAGRSVGVGDFNNDSVDDLMTLVIVIVVRVLFICLV